FLSSVSEGYDGQLLLHRLIRRQRQMCIRDSTNTLPDGTEEVVEVEVPVTVKRDTDGDGSIDSEDPDDDNDGVEDGSDETPKAFTDLTGTAKPATAPDGQAGPADTKVGETKKSDAVISSTPTNGVSVGENGNLVGFPIEDDWENDDIQREVNRQVQV
ncbi:hypothetical protein, partial [Streptococcus uberis]|uniref:hypothetical protein n=1 Tax=Streptococcus uberis TaxID=1349 RepID=UPI0018A702D6